MSAAKNTGGPVHPISTDLSNSNIAHYNGMTLRDYFAAHAPECPTWFKHEPDSPMPHVPFMIEAAAAASTSDELAALMDKIAAKRAARAKWIAEQRAKRFFAWRWHYADMMVAAREAA